MLLVFLAEGKAHRRLQLGKQETLKREKWRKNGEKDLQVKARHVSGDALSANICPKENWTVKIVSRSSLLSHVAFQVVGSPIFFQGKAGGPPLPWHGVTPPHPASCQCIP